MELLSYIDHQAADDYDTFTEVNQKAVNVHVNTQTLWLSYEDKILPFQSPFSLVVALVNVNINF